jgi:hypothetical protein
MGLRRGRGGGEADIQGRGAGSTRHSRRRDHTTSSSRDRWTGLTTLLRHPEDTPWRPANPAFKPNLRDGVRPGHPFDALLKACKPSIEAKSRGCPQISVGCPRPSSALYSRETPCERCGSGCRDLRFYTFSQGLPMGGVLGEGAAAPAGARRGASMARRDRRDWVVSSATSELPPRLLGGSRCAVRRTRRASAE